MDLAKVPRRWGGQHTTVPPSEPEWRLSRMRLSNRRITSLGTQLKLDKPPTGCEAHDLEGIPLACESDRNPGQYRESLCACAGYSEKVFVTICLLS